MKMGWAMFMIGQRRKCVLHEDGFEIENVWPCEGKKGVRQHIMTDSHAPQAGYTRHENGMGDGRDRTETKVYLARGRF